MAPFKHHKTRSMLLISPCRLCRFVGSLRDDRGSNEGRVKRQTIYSPNPNFADYDISSFGGSPRDDCESNEGRVKRQTIYSLNPNFADYDFSRSRALLAFQTKYQRRFVGEGTFGLLHAEFAEDNIRPRLVNPKHVDFSMLKAWLQFCKDHHTYTCSPSSGYQVLGLKVIDCKTRQIVQAENDFRYVALSYVWGAAVLEERDKNVFPATIEDSIRTTLNLGFRYLWVDKYCIDQTDKNERHHQILNMDRIYTMADLTIIAAAGNSPDYGLPGVGPRERLQQKSVQLATTTLVQIIDDRHDIRESAWASRAWTLQEGYLPRRRLIFTDHEVCFLCDHMYCQESVDQKLFHRANGMWDGQDGSHLFGVIPNRNRQHFSTEQILSEYTGRSLSFDADVLNACLGIMRAAHIPHCYGIPIEPDASSGLLIMNLQWSSEKPSCRRLGFPTWSWTSTIGMKIFPEFKHLKEDHCQISVSVSKDIWQTTDEWIKLGGEVNEAQPSQCLRITAPIIRRVRTPLFINRDWLEKNIQDQLHDSYSLPSGNGPFLIIELPDRRIALFKVRLDLETDTVESLHGAVAMLLQCGSEIPRTYTVMLILKPLGDCFQRVGITDWSNEWNWVHLMMTEGTKLPKPGKFIVTRQITNLSEYFKKETIYLE
ncbi:heterokaryon incompatibility protein-domain-containing protein [Phaeosphaeriaceae sp. PMI808]|nr:heterokaryon incompatibility protein-domain-containing protein [Phaeosphaeriaceae sp. PMI808]